MAIVRTGVEPKGAKELPVCVDDGGYCARESGDVAQLMSELHDIPARNIIPSAPTVIPSATRTVIPDLIRDLVELKLNPENSQDHKVI